MVRSWYEDGTNLVPAGRKGGEEVISCYKMLRASVNYSVIGSKSTRKARMRSSVLRKA